MSKKSNLEFNKIAAAILVAAIVAMLSGFAAEAFYKKGEAGESKAFKVAASETKAAPAAIAPEVKVDINALLAAANVSKGEKLFKKCVSCHTVDKGGKHKVGPNVWNIVDQPKASKDGYKYSKALAAAGGDWDVESLYYFLNKPKKFLKGTKMSFAGIKKPEQIADLIAYLQAQK